MMASANEAKVWNKDLDWTTTQCYQSGKNTDSDNSRLNKYYIHDHLGRWPGKDTWEDYNPATPLK